MHSSDNFFPLIGGEVVLVEDPQYMIIQSGLHDFAMYIAYFLCLECLIFINYFLTTQLPIINSMDPWNRSGYILAFVAAIVGLVFILYVIVLPHLNFKFTKEIKIEIRLRTDCLDLDRGSSIHFEIDSHVITINPRLGHYREIKGMSRCDYEADSPSPNLTVKEPVLLKIASKETKFHLNRSFVKKRKLRHFPSQLIIYIKDPDLLDEIMAR